jgi:NADH-quinone oxidoreductase subunit A
MVVATIGLVLSLGAIARSISRVREEKAKDVPATSGELSPEPVWVRYHARYYGYALLFLAFDMEMAYMYPWAVVFRELGVFAYAEIGFFLTVLGLGIAYAWREGALEWS